MSESTSDPKLAALEKSLTALVPVPGRIDRDQLLFRAGQASVRTRPWLWPTSTALLAVVACVLGTALVMRPAPTTADRVVYVPVPPPAGMSAAPRHPVVAPSSPGTLSSIGDTENLWASSAEYLQQRNQAIRWGVDALPQPPSAASSMQTSVESMLGLPEKKAERAEQFHLKF